MIINTEHTKFEVVFRSMTREDWEKVSEIYREGIETGNATFEYQVPDWGKWDSSHLKSCRIVATIDNNVVGWAALAPVSARSVYAGVGEVSIYISNSKKGLKIGGRLLDELIKASEKEGFWTLQAGIFPENKASIKLHQNHGFRIVGYREKIGQMKGIWRDTLLLERRSHNKMSPKIQQSEEKKLVGKRLRMSFSNYRIGELWKAFMSDRKEITNTISNDLISMTLYSPSFFERPDPANEFEKWAALEVSDFKNVPAGMETYILNTGIYAVFDYKGAGNDHAIYDYIFKIWLPESDYLLDDRPHFEVLGDKYKNNDVNSEEEIWIPVRQKH